LAEATEYPSLDIVLELVRGHLRQQFSLSEHVDRRIEILLGLIGVTFAALLGFGTEKLSSLGEYLLAIGVVLLSVASVLSLIAWWPRNMDNPPNLVNLVEKYTAEPMEKTKSDLAEVMAEAYVNNEARLKSRIDWLTSAYISTFMGFLALAAVILNSEL
jgi:hypothetical protein